MYFWKDFQILPPKAKSLKQNKLFHSSLAIDTNHNLLINSFWCRSDQEKWTYAGFKVLLRERYTQTSGYSFSEPRYCIRLLPLVHIRFFTLLVLSAKTLYVKPGSPATMSANTSRVFRTSSSACSRLIFQHMFLRFLFVKGTLSTDPKKLPIMLYTFPRFTLFSLSCFIKSLVYTSMCLCDVQCTFSPIVNDIEWLWLSGAP